MKKLLLVTSIIFLSVSTMVAASFSDGLSGKDIAQKVKDSNHSSKGLVSKGIMILIDKKSNNSIKRNFAIMGIRVKGLKRTMFRFTNSSYKGTTFLTLEKKGNKSNVQYLFLNSVGSPRQIESSDKEKAFIDTDFSNEDMGGGKINDYNYTRKNDKKISGKDCYVIIRKPKRSSSKYSKHILYIRKDILIPVKAKSFNKAGRVVKTAVIKKIKKLREGLYVPTSTIVKDIPERHQTNMKITYVKEKKVRKAMFNKNKMKKRWKVQ